MPHPVCACCIVDQMGVLSPVDLPECLTSTSTALLGSSRKSLMSAPSPASPNASSTSFGKSLNVLIPPSPSATRKVRAVSSPPALHGATSGTPNQTPRGIVFRNPNPAMNFTSDRSAYSYNGGDPDSKSSPCSSYCSYALEHRPDGVVGTMRYMAPEVMAMFANKADRGKLDGCTPALDWFSYGVMVHEMLTGKFPYNPMRGLSYRKLASLYTPYLRMVDNDVCEVHKMVMGNFEPTEQSVALMGEAGVALVTALVERSAGRRLGLNKSSNYTGDVYSELKSHPFFTGVDWAAVDARQMEIPVDEGMEAGIKPDSLCIGPALSLDEVLNAASKEHWCDDDETPEMPDAGTGIVKRHRSGLLGPDQALFTMWNYAHPNVIETECGRHDSQRTYPPRY
jgi:serine/threonine protein kinase